MDVLDTLGSMGKKLIIFCRHQSGPVYLWYEIVSPRYLRQHTDTLAVKEVADEDIVIDSQEEILWRLRGLAGLRNTMSTRILAIGGPDAWSQPAGVVPRLVENIWKSDFRTVPYEELGPLIKAARRDRETVKKAREKAAAYLSTPGTTLETERSFVENAFLLEQVLCGLMKKADCRAVTINGCMGTIMPLAETSACLTLSLLNDAGYLAFCESDYGAAPKVEMSRGQVLTNIVPDFAFKRWVGLKGEIVDSPFLPICRSQIDIRFACDSHTLAQRMPGFHWMTAYGDYIRETGYALHRVNIAWDVL